MGSTASVFNNTNSEIKCDIGVSPTLIQILSYIGQLLTAIPLPVGQVLFVLRVINLAGTIMKTVGRVSKVNAFTTILESSSTASLADGVSSQLADYVTAQLFARQTPGSLIKKGASFKSGSFSLSLWLRADCSRVYTEPFTGDGIFDGQTMEGFLVLDRATMIGGHIDNFFDVSLLRCEQECNKNPRCTAFEIFGYDFDTKKVQFCDIMEVTSIIPKGHLYCNPPPNNCVIMKNDTLVKNDVTDAFGSRTLFYHGVAKVVVAERFIMDPIFSGPTANSNNVYGAQAFITKNGVTDTVRQVVVAPFDNPARRRLREAEEASAAAAAEEDGNEDSGRGLQQTCSDTVATWGKCGGKGFASKCCESEEDSCVFVNSYYSQCRPSLSPSASPSSQPCSGTVDTWSKCAGKGSPTKCCEVDDTCVFVNAYYSQCRPKETSPSDDEELASLDEAVVARDAIISAGDNPPRICAKIPLCETCLTSLAKVFSEWSAEQLAALCSLSEQEFCDAYLAPLSGECASSLDFLTYMDWSIKRVCNGRVTALKCSA